MILIYFLDPTVLQSFCIEHTFFSESTTILQSQGKRTARKLLAKCQKQPWQQPCNLIVSHEETFRQFVSPSHEQTAGLKWPCLFSWKNKVSIAQNSFGQNTFKCFFFLYVCSYTTVVPKHYKEIYIYIYIYFWSTTNESQSQKSGSHDKPPQRVIPLS